jgi:beta-glucosidase
MLPIKQGTRLFVAGPAANNKSSLHGCWSYSWQGNEEEKYPESTKTIVDALKVEFGAQNVVSNAVSNYDSTINFSLNGARSADVIVLCIGENAYAETPGSIKDLNLDANQKELVRLAKNLNKPVVAILVEGRPRLINDIEPFLDGILMAYWPAELGADAIAQVLSGKYNPSGRLPFTYPKTTGHQVLYDHRFSERGEEHTQDGYTYTGYNPQWGFGHGLSYTSFKYEDLTISTDTLYGGDTLKISVQVTNSGSTDGENSIELYTRDHFASIAPSYRRLRAFDKVSLKAGESKLVSFTLTKEDLKFIGIEDTQWTIEEGSFDVAIGDLVKEFYYVTE